MLAAGNQVHIFKEEGKLTLYSLDVERGEGEVISFGSTIDLDGSAFITDGSNIKWEIFIYKDWNAVEDGKAPIYAIYEKIFSGEVITYKPPGSGYYLIKLVNTALGRVVADGTLVALSNGNEAPAAAVNMDKDSAVVGDVIQLDGIDTSDPEGDPLSFTWSYYKVDPAAYRGIYDKTIPYINMGTDRTMNFIPDEHGLYYLKLEVSDNDVDISRDNSGTEKLNAVYVREAGAPEGPVQSEYQFQDNGGTHSVYIDFSDFLWYEILSNNDFEKLNIYFYFEREDFSVIICHYFTTQIDDIDFGFVDYPTNRLNIDRPDLRNIQIDGFTDEQRGEFYNLTLRVFYSEIGEQWHSCSDYNVAEK